MTRQQIKQGVFEMNANKLMIAVSLSFFVATPSFCQSINEKLGDAPIDNGSDSFRRQ